MPYELAPNWSGEYLPHGAPGMPASHPYQFVYARPRWTRRGFTGLGQSGDVVAVASGLVNTAQCNIANLPECSWLDGFWLSSGCEQALQNCIYATGSQGGTANVLDLTPGGQLPPSAGPISTPELQQQTANPTGSNVGADAAAALEAYQAAVKQANACPPGTVAQSDGSCADPTKKGLPWWAYAIAAGLVLLVVVK